MGFTFRCPSLVTNRERIPPQSGWLRLTFTTTIQKMLHETQCSQKMLRHSRAESFSSNTVTEFWLQRGGTREKQGANLEQSEIWMAPLRRAASPGTQDSQLGTCWLPMNYSWNQKLINWKVTFNKITAKKKAQKILFFSLLLLNCCTRWYSLEIALRS